MSNPFSNFKLPSDVSTPERPSRAGRFAFGTEPTTTPAGPPPSASNSFTPAGAPSPSFLGSSMMRGMTSSQQSQRTSSGTPGKPSQSFGRKDGSPLARTGRGAKARGPSSLSQSISAESIESVTKPTKPTKPTTRAGTFRLAFDEFSDDDDDDESQSDNIEDAEEPHEEDQANENDANDDADTDSGSSGHSENDEEYKGFGFTGNTALDPDVEDILARDIGVDTGSEQESSAHGAEDDDEDPFLDMDDDRNTDVATSDGEEDLMLLTTPAADARARQEAEKVFRASSLRRSLPTRRAEFEFASIAREHYSRVDRAAIIQETPNLILETEDVVSHLYDEGIGAKDDAEKLDKSLALASLRATQIWNEYARGLPNPEEDHAAGIGPGVDDDPFKKAAFVADLVIRMHHTRVQSGFDEGKRPPLPEILFQWIKEAHNPYPDQVDEVTHHNPNPICHPLFWQTVRTALVRGEAALASDLLRAADFRYVRKNRGPPAYTGKALESIQHVINQTADMLDTCPGTNGDWNILGSDWTLFRVKARASLNQLQRFAEGADQQQFGASTESYGQSLAGLARKAESRVPWEVYEQLNTVYDIAIGDQSAILETAQDWCEATIGLFGWWDEDKGGSPKRRRLNLLGSTQLIGLEDHFDRLARAIHTAVESDFHFNPQNAVEVALASAFEGNFTAVVGLLREWSLPVASATAEIGSLGQWLPKPQPKAMMAMDTLDDDDLSVLGVPKQGPDEVDGIKDTTLVWYARELAGIDQVSADCEGWEVAVQVLGRMDSVEKSEETVGELLHDILETLQPDSSGTVDKMWKILTDLGLVSFAEETVETFADLLSRDSHRYGEAIWYYALAHKPLKVREVLNLLTSYSLLQSTAFPPSSDLDDHLHRLLTDRGATLEDLARRDLDAAQMVGRMLSGYATLRKFYEIRDEESTGGEASRKRRAAAALVAVVASSDDNIRGGLYDESRDAVVSEDFLLALLGEAMPLVGQSPPALTPEQMDTLLKAIEDLETVGTRVFSSCEEFFRLVLSSAQGLKGSTPADLMQSTGGLGGSFVMLSGSSVLASKLQRTVGTARGPRGWDWRNGLPAGAGATDVLRILRLGLSRELAGVWLREADNVAVF